MKLSVMTLTLGLVILLFQNCGVQQDLDSDLTNSNALGSFSEESSAGGDSLFLSIKDANPVSVNLRYNTSGFFRIGGTCGTGGFGEHVFVWELRRGSGDQAVLGSGRVDNPCMVGRFSMPINVSLGPLLQDPNDATQFISVRYSLTVEILGIDQTGTPVQSPLASSESTVDVVALNEDTQASDSNLSANQQFCLRRQRQNFQQFGTQIDEVGCRPFPLEILVGEEAAAEILANEAMNPDGTAVIQ